MRIALIIACAALALTSAAPAMAAGKKSNESWGKAQVSYAEYRADALECANRAYGVTPKLGSMRGLNASFAIRGTVAIPELFLDPSSRLQLSQFMPVRNDSYTQAYLHAARVDVINHLQGAVDGCLVDKGYSRFQLTPQQMAELRSLPQGTPERARFLHRLGSDAQVLSTQGV